MIAAVKAALGHARRRNYWMRRAWQRRPAPFLPDEVARCVRLARDENRALVRSLRLLANASQPSSDSQRPRRGIGV